MSLSPPFLSALQICNELTQYTVSICICRGALIGSSDLTVDLCSSVAHACSSHRAQRQFKCKLNVEARDAHNSVFILTETLQMQN